MKNNPVVHFEMPYENQERVSAFYQKAFGWDMQKTDAQYGGYVIAVTAETDEKGMNKTPGTINGGFFPRSDEPGKNISSFVISVNDIKTALKDIEAAGGKVVSQPQDIPMIGMWAVFLDPEGNRVSVLQPKRK